MDREPYFTLCSFGPEYKKALGYLGSYSGRDGKKIKEAGLTPVYSDGAIYFAEADMVYICRMLYRAPLYFALFHGWRGLWRSLFIMASGTGA